MPKSHLEEELALHLKSLGCVVEREARFHDTRKWRFDFALLGMDGARLGIEVEGGLYMRGIGGHNRGKLYEGNCEKYNEAVLLGWDVMRFGPNHVKKGYALDCIERWLKKHGKRI